MYSKRTEIGTIILSQNVIGKIVTDAVSGFAGRVLLCNAKGKVSMSDSKGVSFLEFETINDRPIIKIYVLIRFGAGITTITDNLINTVSRHTEFILGTAPEISVIVKGVFSRNVARRNIEVKRP